MVSNCMRCDTALIHGGDHDCDDSEDFLIVSNLTCPDCGLFVLAYTPVDSEPGK